MSRSCLRKRSPGLRIGTGLLLALAPQVGAAAPAADYSEAIIRLEKTVRDEMADWGIGGVAVALVDDQDTIYAAGFGEAQRESVFRCGSISKLFNAVGIMQLVEAGRLDLDAPVQRYGNDLLPANPFGAPVTLRQLLCHRSGMIRESPVGGYLDLSQPGLLRTIDSVAQCVLVNPPNTKTRYSNVGPSIAGRVLELVTGQTFPQYQRQHVLGPLGMTNSAWLLREAPRGRLAPYSMRVADDRGGFKQVRIPAFDLGTIPAGNLFTTAPDLGRFLAMLHAGGRGTAGRVLRPESLAQMFTPQLISETNGFGLAFVVERFRQHKAVSHNGAVYGCSSTLLCLPEARLGVVVLGNEDIVNARITKLARVALSLMLEAKLGEKATNPPAPYQLGEGALTAFAGDYESQSYWARIDTRHGQITADISGQPARLTPLGPLRFLTDSRIHDAVPTVFKRDDLGQVVGFTLGPQEFTRVPPAPPEVPRTWRAYIGAYGSKVIPLVVSARHGHLYAMTENMVDYRLTPLNRHVFALPAGMYADEHLVFLVDGRGRPHSVNMANMILKRW